MDDGRTGIAPCRPVTAEEVAHYQEFGWVKLKGFIRPEVVRTALDMARGRMGDDGDSNPPFALKQPFFNPEFCGALADPKLRPLVEGVGRAAKSLMRRRPGLEQPGLCQHAIGPLVPRPP